MLGSVYAHIFGAANARRDVYELSRRVYEHEDPEFDVDEWVAGAHPLDDHALEHPLVTELVGQDETGPSAALAYMEDRDEDDAGAVIRWMIAGAYKGRFNDAGDFADAQFRDAFEDHYDHWTKGHNQLGFPHVTIGDIMPWDAIGEALAYEAPVRFHMVECGEGVYVFDVTKNPYDYDE